MIGNIQLKICGITSVADGQAGVRIGADYLGFNLYPKSPRYIEPAKFPAISSRLSGISKVAVMVEPTAGELAAAKAMGFDRYQIHFSENFPVKTVAGWLDAVGADKLWLAPRLPPGSALAASLLPLTDTFLIDTFHRDKFGGTGETGDWGRFAALARDNPDRTWILSGGLSPANIVDALAATGARFIDVNSGVESSPGVKDAVKLEALAAGMATRKGL